MFGFGELSKEQIHCESLTPAEEGGVTAMLRADGINEFPALAPWYEHAPCFVAN